MNTCIQVLSGLLTPIIAIVTTYIAWQQYRINRQRIRHELREPRKQIYNAVRDFLLYVMQHGTANKSELTKLIRDTAEARFLFRGKILQHIENLYQRGLDIEEIDLELHDLPKGDARTQLVQKKSQLFKWFKNQLDVTNKLFSKYLRIVT